MEGDEKAFEQMAAFYKTYLRRGRVKHKADVTAVRRELSAGGKH